MLKLEDFSALLSGKFLKTAEDCEAAGRIAARAYADEWKKLAQIFGTTNGEPEPAFDESEEESHGETAKDGDLSREDLLYLIQEMGVK